MLIVMSKKYGKVSDEMKRRLTCVIWDYTDELGIPRQFFLDSKTIQGAIARISGKVANLSESVVLDKTLIDMKKTHKEMETAMKGMGEVDRKLRKVKKSRSKKGGDET